MEEVDGDGSGDDADEVWVCDGASYDVGGVEVPDAADAGESEE